MGLLLDFGMRAENSGDLAAASSLYASAQGLAPDDSKNMAAALPALSCSIVGND